MTGSQSRNGSLHYLDEILSENLLTRKTSDCGGLVIPFIDEPISVDAKDGGVGGVNESLQFLSDTRFLDFYLLSLSDILSNA